jgi:hypothetical protein
MFNLKGVDDKFSRAFHTFFTGADKIVHDGSVKMFSEKNLTQFYKHLEVVDGKRYVKLIVKSAHGGDSSAWAFIDKLDGSVLKPATFSAPAKVARGNIFDDKNGLARITEYGPGYNRG